MFTRCPARVQLPSDVPTTRVLWRRAPGTSGPSEVAPSLGSPEGVRDAVLMSPLQWCGSLHGSAGLSGLTRDAGCSPQCQCFCGTCARGDFMAVSVLGVGDKKHQLVLLRCRLHSVALWQLRQVALAPLTSRWWQKHHYVRWCSRFLISWKQKIHLWVWLESWLYRIASPPFSAIA